MANGEERIRAHRWLRGHYEISKVLTRFESVELTVPRVLDLLGSVVPLRSVIVVLEPVGTNAPVRAVAWNAKGQLAVANDAALSHAEKSYQDFVGTRGALPVDDEKRRFIFLPLVVDHGRVFGGLQVEGDRGFNEDSLAFTNAVANQLAIAIDRAAIIQKKQTETEGRRVAAEQLTHDAQVNEETQRALKEEAQRAVQARQDVLAIVSHDLKNPLTAILMAGELALASQNTESLNHALERIQEAAKRMNRIISDLLDSASIEAGKLATQKSSHRVEALIKEEIDLSLEMAKKKQVTLLSEVSGEKLMVYCDRERLLQVLDNLIVNAIKFTPLGGSIRVRAEQLDGKVQFSVIDTGPGIAPELTAIVFDRYGQAKNTAHLGSGLGLFIAKGIVEAHGGRIWAENMPKGGAKIAFTIPNSVSLAAQQ